MTPVELRKFLRKILAEFPPPKPVRVRQVRLIEADGTHTHGCTWSFPSHFLIHIHAASPKAMQQDVIMHELAHCLTWSDDLHHSAAWAMKYRQLQRWAKTRAAMERWIAGEGEYRASK